MKIRPTLLLAVALCAMSSPVASFAAASSAAEFRPFVLALRPGSTPAETRQALGAPHATLGPDLWIYWNFGDPNPNAANPAYDTLVVAFADDRVTAVKTTDGRVVRQLLEQAARAGKNTAVAASATPSPR